MKKVVVKLDLHDNQAKRKAMKTVATLKGIDSISMDMKGKKLTVIGTADAINIVSKLRKYWPTTEILLVGAAKEPEKEKPPEKKEEAAKPEEAKKEEAKKEGGGGGGEEQKKEEGNKEGGDGAKKEGEGGGGGGDGKKKEEEKKPAPAPAPPMLPYYYDPMMIEMLKPHRGPYNNPYMNYHPYNYYPSTAYYHQQPMEENPASTCTIC